MNREERERRAQEWHRFYERSGLTIRELARELGVDRKTVERTFKAHGLPVRPVAKYEPEWYPDVE